MPGELMTVKDVAAYLRLGERKVYDLLARREIPAMRVAGKWLFARSQIDLWLAEHAEGPAAGSRAAPPDILAGSHDPLLEWAVRQAGTGLATLNEGSLAGLERVAARGAIACGLHVLDAASGGYNLPLVRARLAARPLVLIHWARRRQGLVVAAGNPMGVRGIADLPRLRLAMRQKEAGSYVLLHHLLGQAGLPSSVLLPAGPPLHTETEVAQAVADGRADAGLAVAAVARLLRLDFVPLVEERFDLLVWRRAFFEAPFQKLLAFARTSALTERATALGGYDVEELGTVLWNGR
ncbi:helix-turn-helix transcriptional regulator [Geminicoccaceae bacterium 1502E]|nr:helix-turn-helix transcriptional regulator [Geminicoccaceae bacterium 1502E]